MIVRRLRSKRSAVVGATDGASDAGQNFWPLGLAMAAVLAGLPTTEQRRMGIEYDLLRADAVAIGGFFALSYMGKLPASTT